METERERRRFSDKWCGHGYRDDQTTKVPRDLQLGSGGLSHVLGVPIGSSAL